ncbi:MAG: conjugal transfer protein TraF [Elusimicrobiales bacterium]|nr:conjugal transfer protein TraF [Elusimicrobiales bacterium]
MRATLLSLISVFFLAGTAGAEQWQVLGTRPMGMGGAFVAVAQGPIAQYWNPAGLVKTSANVSGMELPVGVGLEATGGILKNASQIGDMADQLNAIQTAQETGGAITPKQAGDFVKTMSLLADMNKPGKGILVEANGGVNFKFSKLALSVNNFTSVGANPFIDVNNLNLGAAGNSIFTTGNGDGSGLTNTNGNYASATTALTAALDSLDTTTTESVYQLFCGGGQCDASITDNDTLAIALANYADSQNISPEEVSQAAALITQYSDSAAPVLSGALSGGSYTDNTSNLTLDAASFIEVAAGYAWNMDKYLSGLSLGANLKMVNGRIATSTFRFMTNSETGDAFDDMLEDAKSSWAPAADLGLLWNVNAKYPGVPFRPRLGIVGRNLNSPKFDRPDTVGGDYTLDRQVRLGLAFNPANFWTLAADVDLTENDTPVDGFKSRQLALGTEINVFNRKAFNIPLRAGIMKNIAESSSKTAYTLGTGLNLLYMHFDVSGVLSTEKTTIDDSEIPAKVGVTASFGLLF